eukprot:TRINITY_DN9472_c0_g1_i2.p1 TRINITY_DN9472_c0_g1~~TRINITY_DN9472_c0_g1_i2.p1  ORF type:complete len:120 (+),score=23.73 TRINITY_DN9472_c0_g1_i2:65-424(+)
MCIRDSFYSIFVTIIWPSIALIVDTKYLGTAYGLTTAVQNSGMALFPLIVGYLHDTFIDDGKAGYFWVSIFLIVMAIFGFLFTVLLLFFEIKSDGPLEKVQKITIDEEEPIKSVSLQES